MRNIGESPTRITVAQYLHSLSQQLESCKNLKDCFETGDVVKAILDTLSKCCRANPISDINVTSFADFVDGIVDKCPQI